ncbi:MAG: DUF4440 domain-containing protein [Armatimonadota bacterium]
MPILLLAQTATSPRLAIEQQYKKWDRAVLAHNKKAMQNLLSPKFTAKALAGQIPLNRTQFIKAITSRWRPGAPKEQSYVTKINDFAQTTGACITTVSQSIVYKYSNNTTRKAQFKLIDTWKMVGKNWILFSSDNLI